MADGTPMETSQMMGALNDFGGNHAGKTGKMTLGTPSKKSRKKAPNLPGKNRFPRPVRKGM
jgi:hypothetical protein